MKYQWHSYSNIESKKYTCGYCGQPLSSDKGYVAKVFSDSGADIRKTGYICICHNCSKPTFIDENNRQTPGHNFGNDVKHIDNQDIKSLYEEARKCYSVNSFTSVILSCRKLLMHIAVEKGAGENLKFIQYVEYLSEKNYIPPDAKGWVDHIREKGNEANHEIVIMKEEDAKDLLAFIEMLLKLVYEFPSNIKQKTNTQK